MYACAHRGPCRVTRVCVCVWWAYVYACVDVSIAIWAQAPKISAFDDHTEWRPVRQEWCAQPQWGPSFATTGFTKVGTLQYSFATRRIHAASFSAAMMPMALCCRTADGMALRPRMYARDRWNIPIVLAAPSLRQQGTSFSYWMGFVMRAWIASGRMTP